MVEEMVKKTTDGAKVNPNSMVRVNSDVQKIDKFFRAEPKPEANQTEAAEHHNVEVTNGNDNDNEDINMSLVEEPVAINKMPEKWKNPVPDQANITYVDPKESFKTRTFQYERTETKLTSVKQLRMEIERQCNTNLREILANLIFIGCIDLHKSLVQHSTKLYLCDTTRLA